MARLARLVKSLLVRPPLPRPLYGLVVSAAAVAWAGGCTVGPDYRRPNLDLPAGWVGTGKSTTNPASQPSVAVSEPARLAVWWTVFGDHTLDSLVHRAGESNLSLRQAGARVRQARAVRVGAVSGLFPVADAAGGYRRTGRGRGESTPSPTGLVRGRSSATDQFQAGFDASWELDVFGGVRRNVEASTADLQAAVEDERDVFVSLLSEVALNYLNLRGAQEQIAIARRNLDYQSRTLELTRKLVGGGFRAGLDVVNSEALVASTSSQIPSLESSAQQSIYALSVLLGSNPATLLQELDAPAPIPPTPPDVPVGLPSDLLRRRPDVRRAERQLAAATARVGVATAELYPRFTLSGSIDTSGRRFGNLGNIDNRSWSFGPNFSWRILDFGRIRADIEIQSAAQESALYAYQQSVLIALQDVENSLVAYAKEQQRRRFLADAVAANTRAVSLSTQLYQQGLSDFLDVLDAQRSLLGSQNALIQSNLNVSTNLVALYKALGGGWENAGLPTPPEAVGAPGPKTDAPPTSAPTRRPDSGPAAEPIRASTLPVGQ